MSLLDDLSLFCCQNPDGPAYGLRGRSHLRVGFRYGPRQQRRLRVCRTCQTRFSERKGSAFFGSRLPDDRAQAVCAHLQDGCGVRQTARLVGVAKDTVVRYTLRAGTHAQQTHDERVAFSPHDPGSAAR